ncbi:28S ribosomal protein s9, mitochondrial [Plakobranchus ocellatus]|uniref:Small ribosomal subunit protein uS9m n=1 Tax=Plakobranchus ocellatus TaxID=259542 RepID=A0AAV4C935_9GAST|nr:28S ribosomal protein s9, mitochondrial [Plakobranchus ocellatus]
MAVLSPWTRRMFLKGNNMPSRPVFTFFFLKQNTDSCHKHACGFSTAPEGEDMLLNASKKTQNKPTAKAVTISRAMKAYMEQAKAYDDKMKAEVADYEIGKRHLANIMGEDPDSFTQADVDRAIEYLLPSSIYDKKARPIMKDPYEVFPKKKAAQFGLDGRPYHWMYFTILPNYYSMLYEITWKLEALKEAEDQLRAERRLEEMEGQVFNAASSEWLSLHALKTKLVENIKEKEYNHFVTMMERLAAHPLSGREQEFIMSWRISLQAEQLESAVQELEVEEGGRMCATAKGTRKSSNAIVKVYKPGSGNFIINGKDLTYFTQNMYRETLLLPFIVSGLLGKVDVEADVEMGGPTGQAGAIRLGLSRALTAFVDEDVKEKMRLSGLLTKDPRKKERKKPGQEGARRKFTWKKR